MTTTFITTDSFDGRTIKVLTRISTTKLARKAAQKAANEHGDEVTLIRLTNHGRRDLVDIFQPKDAADG